MIKYDEQGYYIQGDRGKLPIKNYDKVLLKFGMISEGECESIGPTKAAEKFGYTRQRYYQLLKAYKQHGVKALMDKKTGPKSKYRTTGQVIRQIIRFRYYDRDMSAEVIAQNLKQMGFKISISSVEKVITDFGLQKKTSFMQSEQTSEKD